MTTPRIDPDDLVVPELLRVFGDSKYPIDEAQVARCLDPTQGFPADVAWQPALFSLIRTSILHVVSAVETTHVIQSAGDYPMTELPHLPYPRVAIEAMEDAGWLLGTEDMSTIFHVWAVFVSERRVGEVWDCAWYWAKADCLDDEDPFEATGGPVLFFSVHAREDGIHTLSTYDEPMAEHQAKAGEVLKTFALELAHIISADKVPHEPVGFVSRQQRRQWKAKHPYIITTDKPRVYYVNLDRAGETSHEEGDGSRVFHCRWLVRGHWRHYKGGMTKDGKRTFNKKSVWVKAHVRGPVGAPWKGRPIYTQEGEQ